MKVKLKIYRREKLVLERNLNKYPHRDLHRVINDTAQETGVSLLAILHFYGELRGFDEELYKRIEKFKKFYGVTDVEE